MTLACLTCPLPDCDEKSPRCPLRRTWSLVRRMRSKEWADKITPAEREAYNAYFRMWKIDHDAQRSEGTPA